MLRRANPVLVPILTILSAVFPACTRRPPDDAAIQSAVKAKLHEAFGPIEHRQAAQMERGADQEVVSYIDVASTNGQVVLSGEVRSNRAKAKAEQIAKSVPHVVAVLNQLGVAPGYSDDAVGPADPK